MKTVKQHFLDTVDNNEDLLNSLMYGSYRANRINGLSHKQLVNIGIGNTAMLLKYNTECFMQSFENANANYNNTHK